MLPELERLLSLLKAVFSYFFDQLQKLEVLLPDSCELLLRFFDLNHFLT